MLQVFKHQKQNTYRQFLLMGSRLMHTVSKPEEHHLHESFCWYTTLLQKKKILRIGQ